MSSHLISYYIATVPKDLGAAMFEKFILWVAERVLGSLNLRRILRWLKSPAVMIAGGTHFSVVMADLADDVGLKQTGHVARILGGHMSRASLEVKRESRYSATVRS